MASLVTISRMQQCFNVLIDIYHEFLLLLYCCVLLEIKITTTTISPRIIQAGLMLKSVECRYNAIGFIPILHTALLWQQQNINQTSNSQQTPHSSPSRVSYGVSIMRILKKIVRVITAPQCCNSNLSTIIISIHIYHYKLVYSTTHVIQINFCYPHLQAWWP